MENSRSWPGPPPFKLVHRKQLGKKGKELAGLDAAALRKLPDVAKAFAEGRAQVEHYRAALVKREGELDLRCHVVAVGLERILGDEVEAVEPRKAPTPRGAASA